MNNNYYDEYGSKIKHEYFPHWNSLSQPCQGQGAPEPRSHCTIQRFLEQTASPPLAGSSLSPGGSFVGAATPGLWSCWGGAGHVCCPHTCDQSHDSRPRRCAPLEQHLPAPLQTHWENGGVHGSTKTYRHAYASSRVAPGPARDRVRLGWG